MTTAVAGPAGCRVWHARLGDVRPALASWLSADERARCSSFVRQHDRDRFLLGACLVRLAVSRHTGTAPEAVPVDRTCPTCGRAHGRPVVPGQERLRLSVSHSSDRVLVAVADVEVGIDLELVRADLPVGELTGLLSPEEAAAVDRAGGPEAVRAFLVSWTRREAVLKAWGVGLGTELPLRLSAADAPPVLRSGPQRDGGPAPLSLLDLRAGSDYVGCLATARPVRPVWVDGGRALAAPELVPARPGERPHLAGPSRQQAHRPRGARR